MLCYWLLLQYTSVPGQITGTDVCVGFDYIPPIYRLRLHDTSQFKLPVNIILANLTYITLSLILLVRLYLFKKSIKMKPEEALKEKFRP